MGKSQNKFRKGSAVREDSLDKSASGSKSFRMKTSAIKGIRDDIIRKEKEAMNIINDQKMVEQLQKEKNKIKEIKDKVARIMQKEKKVEVSSDKNKDLYLKFKIEINKLVTSDHFESRLKKLVSFLKVGDGVVPSVKANELEDNILKNLMTHVSNLQRNTSYLDQVAKVREEYEQKMNEKLRVQEVNLRA